MQIEISLPLIREKKGKTKIGKKKKPKPQINQFTNNKPSNILLDTTLSVLLSITYWQYYSSIQIHSTYLTCKSTHYKTCGKSPLEILKCSKVLTYRK